MAMLKKIASQVRGLFRPPDESEMEREFGFHVEMETSSLIAAGLPAEEARRRALASFGGGDRYREEMRDGWIRRWLADAAHDVRFALRGLRRTPVFAVTAIGTLAIGLGGTAAVLSAVNAVLRAPLPYPDEDRIVRIFQRNSETNRWSLSVADMLGIEGWQQSFTAVTAVRTGQMALTGGTEPVWIRAGRATSGLFSTFGVEAARGRTFTSSDASADAPPVVVITSDLARRHFGAAAGADGAGAVGRTVVLDRVSHTVIGVLAPEITTLGGITADAWPLMRLEQPNRRGPFGLAVFGRLRPDVTREAAAVDLERISERLFPMYAPGFNDRTAKLTPYALREILFGDATKSLLVLSGAVVLVLLVALANVSNLVLVRAVGRRRETALRTALGAGRVRITRLVLTENLVLALLGGVLALPVAVAGLTALHKAGPAMPRLETASLDMRMILATLLIAAACGVGIAVYPLMFTTARGVADALRGSDRRSSSGRGTRAVQDGLVVAEFALALPLVTGAALLLHSFMSMQHVDVGIDASNIVAMRVSLPPSQYGDSAADIQFWDDALREVVAVPGVLVAGLASALPPDNQGASNNFNLVDRPVPAGAAEPASPWTVVTPEMFTALRVPLLAGRMFDERDDANAPPVLIVSRTWAERYFPGQSPLGRQLVEGGCLQCPLSTIIGVVGDIRYSGLTGSGEGVFAPYSQWGGATMQLVVRASSDPTAVLAPVRARLHAIDPGLPLLDVQLLADRLSGAITTPRNWTLMVGGFAGIALVLAALGVFGVMSYSVAQQQREIGVRLALGATPTSVVRLVLGRGVALAAAGAALGVVAALYGTRLLQHVLFDISPTDARTFALVTLSLIAVATVACYLPGRRAARIDPASVIAGD